MSASPMRTDGRLPPCTSYPDVDKLCVRTTPQMLRSVAREELEK